MATDDSNSARGKTMLAVDGRRICFYFGRKNKSTILNSVNIAVNRGTIYSLLGPSGCGKTTLLKCIVGQHKPQAGTLKVFGRSPGSKGFFIPGRGVGYMPQELALYMEMTIEEILTYFGSLSGMGMKCLSERITFLVDLLELPGKRKQIQHLSGGQQRRVSFAIALIHNPPVLVLDEPTVGVDPILRKSIWDHLVGLAMKEHLTVIITTHYTEEARQAHTVGLMRGGHLIAERSPEALIKQCEGFTLEDAFLKLCQKNRNEDDDVETNIDEIVTDRNHGPKFLDANSTVLNETANGESCSNGLKFVKTSGETLDERNGIQDNTVASLSLPPFPTETDHLNFSATNCWKRLFYLTRKNFLRIRGNIPLMFFLVGVCTVQLVAFFLSFSSDPFDLQVAVVNEEEGLNRFGEKFLLSISDRTIYKKPFHNFTLAYESVTKGESWAALHINSEFSTCLVDRFLEGADASNDTIHCSRINFILDMSDYVIAATISKIMFESYAKFVRDTLKSLGKNPLLGDVPLHLEQHTYGSKPAEFSESVTPGVILCIAYLSAISLTEMALIAEKKHGLLTRTLVAGATTTEVLLSFFFALLFLLFLEVVTTLVVAFAVFSVPCHGSFLWVVVAIMVSGLCGMSYGLFISSVTDDENIACLVSFGSFFPLVVLSGAFWPLEAMPHYLRYFSNCLPLTRIIHGTRSVMTRGWNVTENNTWDGFLICSLWIIVLVVFSIILSKIRK